MATNFFIWITLSALASSRRIELNDALIPLSDCYYWSDGGFNSKIGLSSGAVTGSFSLRDELTNFGR